MKRALFVLFLVSGITSAVAQDFYNKGKLALSGRDTAGAVAAFQDALKAGQKTADVNYYLGAIAFNRHAIDDAIGYLHTSLKANDENVDALLTLGSAYLAKKDPAAALASLRRAAKLAPKNGAVSMVYGMALLEADSTDQAIRQLTLANVYDPTNGAVFSALGDCYLKQNVVVLAITNYQKAVDLDNKNIAFRVKLAKAYLKNRQYTEAVKEYDGITGLDSTYADGYLEVGRIYVLAKQYKNGIGPLKTYVRMRPKSVEGATFLSKAYFGADDHAEAAKAVKRALELDSSNVEMWRIEAHSLTELKEYPGALVAFAALQRRKALKPEDQSKYGSSLVGVGREEEAIQALLAAVAADSTNCDPYFNLGFLYMKKQNYEKAAAAFEKKIACDPRSLSSYLNAAASYWQLKNFVRVRELLTRMVELKSDFLQGRLWMARYYTQVDSLDYAKQQYDEVLKIIGSNPEKYKKEAGEAHGLIGSYYFGTHQFEKAIQAFRDAQSFGYDVPGLHLSWGQAMLQLLDPKAAEADNIEKVKEAVKHFRKAVEKDPGNPQAHLWLAEGLIRSRVPGNDKDNQVLKDEACVEYRKVLKLEPRNEDAKKGMEHYGCPGAGK